MKHNRYVVCRSMDGMGGRDLMCQRHGEGKCPGDELVVVAPVEELKRMTERAEEAERRLKWLDKENARLHDRIADLEEDREA